MSWFHKCPPCPPPKPICVEHCFCRRNTRLLGGYGASQAWVELECCYCGVSKYDPDFFRWLSEKEKRP